MNMQTEITTKRAVLYCRVSTKEQVEEGNSLVSQEKICRDYAFKNGYDIAEIFIEQGESAKTADRKELQRLLAYCSDRKNKISYVIAYKIDRISRNVYDYSQLRIILKRYGVEIKSTTEHFEDNPAGRFMENIIANVAQFDNDVRAERCAGGMKEAMREGRYVWVAPLGYDNSRIMGKATIVPNKLAPLVRKTFEAIAKNTFPAEEVRKMMIKEGLVSKKGKAMSKSQFYRFLKNECYAGWIIKFGERHKGLYDLIVPQELFDQVQRVLKHRGKRNFHYNKENPDFPLRRFIHHPSGRKLTGAWSKGRSKKYPYYCFQQMHLSFKRDELEESFLKYFDFFKIDGEDYKELCRLAKEHFSAASEDQRIERSRIEKHIQEIKEKQRMLIQKNYKGIVSDTVLKQESECIEQELFDAHAILAVIPERKISVEKLLEMVSEFLKKPSEIWKKAHFEERLLLQWFNFPKGVCFEQANFRTGEISSVFNAKHFFLTPQLRRVHLTPQATNNSKITNKLADAEEDIFWQKFATDLEKLAQIIEQIETRQSSP